MSVPLPDELKGILDAPNFAHLATVDETGAPHVTTMWVGRDGDHIVFNTAEGRKKWRNIDGDPRVSVAIYDAAKPYVTYTVQGRVVEMTRDGADQGIDDLAKKYLDLDEYPYRVATEVRTRVVIEATHVSGMH